jgi:hypothetical protein
MRPHTFQPRNSTFLLFYDLPHPPATTIDVLRPPATSIEPQRPRSKPSDHSISSISSIDHFRYSAQALYPSARPRDPQRSSAKPIDHHRSPSTAGRSFYRPDRSLYQSQKCRYRYRDIARPSPASDRLYNLSFIICDPLSHVCDPFPSDSTTIFRYFNLSPI